jgi:hypothetical protein
MIAWVITIQVIEGSYITKNKYPKIVAAIISARSSKATECFMRNIHYLLREDLTSQKNLSKYNKNKDKKSEITVNQEDGIVLYLTDGQFLIVAHKSKIIGINNNILTWRGLTYRRYNYETLEVLEEIVSPIESAPQMNISLRNLFN